MSRIDPEAAFNLEIATQGSIMFLKKYEEVDDDDALDDEYLDDDDRDDRDETKMKPSAYNHPVLILCPCSEYYDGPYVYACLVCHPQPPPRRTSFKLT